MLLTGATCLILFCRLKADTRLSVETTTTRLYFEIVSGASLANGLLVGTAIYRGEVARAGHFFYVTRDNKKTYRFRVRDSKPIWINEFASFDEIEL